MKNNLTIIIAILLVFCGRINGQPAGALDTTFNHTGKVVYDNALQDLYNDVKVQTDGKIVATGASMSSSYAPWVEVSRLLPDGSFDPSFGTNGFFTLSYKAECGAYKFIIKDNGKILVCGYATDYTEYGVLLFQLNEDGTLDPAFGDSGIVYQPTGLTGGFPSNFYAMALQTDQKIIVAGYLTDNTYNQIPVVLRFTETGLLDVTFGTNGIAGIPVTQTDNTFSAIALQSDGKILAAGHISNGLSWFSLLIARFDPNGNLDTGYGSGGIVNLNLNNVDDKFFDLRVLSGNETVLTGVTVSQADLYYHMLLMRFDNTGVPDATFGTNGSVIFGDVPYTVGYAMITQPDGKILVSGVTGDLQPASNEWALWRFNMDGSPDLSFGNSGLVTTDFFGHSQEALGIALYEDKIILAGKTRNTTDYLDFAVARYVNDLNVTASVKEITSTLTFTVSPNPVKRNGLVRLEYELKKEGGISIELLSSAGIPVKELLLGKQPAGKHSYPFLLPSNVSAGVFFLRISGSGFTNRTVKLVVID